MNLIICLIVIFVLIAIFSKTPVIPKSHWDHHFDAFQFSAQEFYNNIEQEIQKRKMPNVSFTRSLSPEKGIFSTRREYLTVTRGEYVFDICAAPFGTGFFVSWWLGEHEEGLAAKIPILNKLPGNRRNKTYYQIDIECMFKSAVHSAVLNVINNITTAKGVRPLSELERQPKDGLFSKSN